MLPPLKWRLSPALLILSAGPAEALAQSAPATTVETATTSADRSSLEAEFAAALAQDSTPAPPAPAASWASPSVRLIDIALDFLGAGGGSSGPAHPR